MSITSRKISLDEPDIGEIERDYLNQCLDSGFISTFGPYVSQFEDRMKQFLNVPAAAALQSGTAALHLALHELGIGEGDEVIVPALTFVATVNPVTYVGAKPVIADIDAYTWNLDARGVEAAVTEKTKAVIPVHLYGNPCGMDALKAVARKYNLFVIEDATESLGSTYKGQMTGTFGDMGCLSFNGNKMMTTAGGGMVVGNAPELLAHIKFLADQARDATRGYYHPEVGFNYRMTNLEASLGLAQLSRMEEFLAKKKKFHEIYTDELAGLPVEFQQVEDGAKPNRWLNAVTFEPGVEVSEIQSAFSKKGILSRRIFVPLTEFPPYENREKEQFKNAYDIYNRGLCLPSSTLNKEEDIMSVCSVLKELL